MYTPCVPAVFVMSTSMLRWCVILDLIRFPDLFVFVRYLYTTTRDTVIVTLLFIVN